MITAVEVQLAMLLVIPSDATVFVPEEIGCGICFDRGLDNSNAVNIRRVSLIAHRLPHSGLRDCMNMKNEHVLYSIAAQRRVASMKFI